LGARCRASHRMVFTWPFTGPFTGARSWGSHSRVPRVPARAACVPARPACRLPAPGAPDVPLLHILLGTCSRTIWSADVSPVARPGRVPLRAWGCTHRRHPLPSQVVGSPMTSASNTSGWDFSATLQLPRGKTSAPGVSRRFCAADQRQGAFFLHPRPCRPYLCSSFPVPSAKSLWS